MDIKFLKRKDIDDKRWNGCVHFAYNALPYAYTWFLDNVCEEWNGVVAGDYKLVLPVVHGRKFGMSYIYQPFFTQQLGVFTDNNLNPVVFEEMMNAIPNEYRYIEMHLNSSNPAPQGFEASKRVNYLLDLSRPYEQIRSGYSGNLLRKLKKAEKSELKYKSQIKPETFVEFYIRHAAPKIPNFKGSYQYNMFRVIYKAMFYSAGACVGVFNDKEELLAANFLLFHPSRTINLMPVSSPEGNKLGAMAFLMDTVVRIGANQKKFLDFEGSMLPGVAKFYQSFGAEESHYHYIKRNKLPWFARIFKR